MHENLGKLPSIRTSTDSSVHHSHSPSVNSSLCAANPSKFPCNYGEKNAVNYLHENPVKSPSISTSYIMPFSAPVCASSVQSVCTLSIMSVIAPVCELSIQPVHTLCITSVIAPICASSIHHALCLSLHLSMHCPLCLSIPLMTNIRNFWKNSLVLSMGRNTHMKLQ